MNDKQIAVGFLGGSLAIVLVGLLSHEGAEEALKPVGTVLIEHGNACIPLISFVETDKPEMQDIASPFLDQDTESFVLSIHDWVSANVKYPLPYYQNGAATWYLPTEVIDRKVSGCFGTSVLTASLLRQKLSPKNVYVAIGTHRGSGHAWVMARLNSDWHIIETTHADHFQTDGYYQPVLLFNDKTIVGRRNSVDFLDDYLCGSGD